MHMPYPTVSDDGSRVEIDLHGASVPLARDMLDRLLREARRRGRWQVRVVHGSSTYDRGGPSIKAMLYDELDTGRWSREVGSHVRFDEVTVLSLKVTAPVDPRSISILDISP